MWLWGCDRLFLCGRCLRPVALREPKPASFTTGTRIIPNRSYPERMAKNQMFTAKAFWKDIRSCTPNCIVAHTRSFSASDVSRKDSSDRGAPRKRKTQIFDIIKWGLMTVGITATVSMTVMWWELHLLKRNMTSVTAAYDPNTEHLDDSFRFKNDHFVFTEDCGILESPVKMVFPWIQSKSHDPFVLLKLCQSENPKVRQIGIEALTEKTLWEDYQYRYIAQAADYRTLIGLSRTEGADRRFFLPPPKLADSDIAVVEELASVLLTMEHHNDVNNLSKTKINSHSASATALALIQDKHGPTDEDKRWFWGFEGSSTDVVSVDGRMPDDQLLLEILYAISKLCCVSAQAFLFVKKQGLAVLQRLVEQFDNTETFIAVAVVLGNLALYPGLHEEIVDTGWLGVLKEWSESSNTQLATAAARCLANMDTDFDTEVLEDGMLILYPLKRSKKKYHADIVFVHGLLGGAVKTWRQLDRIATDNDCGYSDCWPKDWLAEDCPHVRIISVHYDTSLSSWTTCADDKYRCTLEGRGRELLEKLHHAGVGKRPIIWVGHSMGGLLIKQMLDLANTKPFSGMKDKTCGVLLYAVPHRGLSIAALTSQIHYILYPSIEVQELRKDSAHLRRIHAHFKEFIEDNGIPCLSFGETLKTKFRKTLPKILLVPQDSSDPSIGEFCPMPLDHVSICKPENRDSLIYQKSLAFIHRALIFSYIHRLRQAMSESLEALD